MPWRWRFFWWGSAAKAPPVALPPAYDFDNDGWKDLFFALSHFSGLGRYTGKEIALPNRLFRNIAGARFEDVSASAGPGFLEAAEYRGVAFADFDTARTGSRSNSTAREAIATGSGHL